MKPKWYDRIDWEPVLWFFMSAIFICAGSFIFINTESKSLEALATLFSALGGAGIARVRSSKAIKVD